MKRNTTMWLPNLSLAGMPSIDTTRQWAPGMGYKVAQLRKQVESRWLDAKWSFKKRGFELDADTVSAGIVFGSMLVFATVGMIALMAFINIGHAEQVVHDEDLYNLSKAPEPSAGPDAPIIEPVMVVEPHVTRSYDDGRSVTTVNETPAVVTNRVMAPDVRVMLPSGEIIVAANPLNAPWWQDERVVGYRTYYYDSDRNIYVVTGETAQRPAYKQWENRWDADGRPCPAGSRSC